MSSASESILTLPGGALVALEQIRASNRPVRAALAASLAAVRAKTDLADLRAVIRLCPLPEPRLAYNELCGAVGTFAGTDKLIEYAVREWAEAFSADVVMVEPVMAGRDRNGKAVVDAGWVVMQAHVDGLGFTVGGRLVEAVTAR